MRTTARQRGQLLPLSLCAPPLRSQLQKQEKGKLWKLFPSLPCLCYCPTQVPCEDCGAGQDAPTGQGDACWRRGTASPSFPRPAGARGHTGSIRSRGPTAACFFLWDKMATPQLQNVLTSAAGRGPEGSPSPAKAALGSKGTAAIVWQDWMLPCIHFALMKAHSSEEKYLHSASQVVTFAQMTHKQAAPRSLFQSKPL